ncbi:hypothetical protein D3C86_1470060 [compost metagenome]
MRHEFTSIKSIRKEIRMSRSIKGWCDGEAMQDKPLVGGVAVVQYHVDWQAVGSRAKAGANRAGEGTDTGVASRTHRHAPGQVWPPGRSGQGPIDP